MATRRTRRSRDKENRYPITKEVGLLASDVTIVTLKASYTQPIVDTNGILYISATDLGTTGYPQYPPGLGPLMNFYNKYCVLRTKVKCTLQNTSTGVPGFYPFHVTLLPQPMEESVLAYPNPITQHFAKNTVMGTVPSHGKQTMPVITHDMRSNVVFGITEKSLINNEQYSGNLFTSPTRAWHYLLYINVPPGVSTPNSPQGQVFVELEYTIRLTDGNKLVLMSS